jgi:hypothetical protein
MNAATKHAIECARPLLKKSGATDAEADLLIRSALECPPRGARPDEAVKAISLALSMNPHIKEHLIDLAHLPKEDRERVQELAAWERENMPRFNVGFPFCVGELREALDVLLRALWPDAHQSCLAGAVIVGVVTLRDRWVLNPFAVVKCMRETAEADRTMRLGHGR